jgi:hypothetical protein
MDVDTYDSEIDAIWQAAGLKVLNLRSYGFDTDLSVLVCTTCGTGVHPKNPVVHAQVDGIKLTKAQVALLSKTIPTLLL